MSNSEKTKNLRVRTTAQNKDKLGAIAQVLYGTSMSDAVRTMSEELYHDFFGQIDPQALVENRLPEEQVRALLAKEMDPSEVDDEYLLDGDDDSEDERVIASDGGVTRSPSSYSSTLTPAELAQSGPELSWEALRDVVADEDGYWSETLELHPDRVGSETMKSNRQKVPRILAAMARHEAGDRGFVNRTELKRLVREHVTHLLRSRKDDTDGKQWIVNQYLTRTLDHLYAHPTPGSPMVFTDEEKYLSAANRNLASFREDAEDLDRLFKPAQWDDHREWHEAVAQDAETVATAFVIGRDVADDDIVPLDTVDARAAQTDEYKDTSHFLVRHKLQWVANFSRLPEDHREAILGLMDDEVVDQLQLVE